MNLAVDGIRPGTSTQDRARGEIPATLLQPGAWIFWFAVTATGAGAGLATIALTRLLEVIQGWLWSGSGTDILDAASHATAARHVIVLAAAGLATALGQLLLRRLSSGNGIDITTALWFSAGRLPALRTLGSAVLSVGVVAMGAALGREGAPKQAGAVFANVLSDRVRLTDEQRRLLVACGAGAGLAAAYGVPLGGALFALEVLRGALALRLVLPAILASLIATSLSWLALPNAATYQLPVFNASFGNIVWAGMIGVPAGIVSVAFVRSVAWADRRTPRGAMRLVAPILVLGALGPLSISFPQLLGNGRDLSQLLFGGAPQTLGPLATLFLLRPLATLLCLGSGTPGGLFTPSLTVGALLGGLLGFAGSRVWPGLAPGFSALVGAGAVLAATTQGPISAVVLMMELTGQGRSFLVPLLFGVVSATLVSRTLEPRSIYEARLSDAEVQSRLAAREPSPVGGYPASG